MENLLALFGHEGDKYIRVIRGRDPVSGETAVVAVDVFNVCAAFEVTDPPIFQAVKKLLFPGTRGKGNRLADLIGAKAAISRAIDLERENMAEEAELNAAIAKTFAEQEHAPKPTPKKKARK
jgi:hypothetical protein